MEVRYHPSSDMLNIELSETRSVESEEVHEGFVFDFDADGRVVSIEVDQASARVNLELIKKDPASVVQPLPPYDGELFTAGELAARLGLEKRTFNRIVQFMREAGKVVGLRPDVPIYTEQDEATIDLWRKEHPRGRPKKAVAEV